MVRRGITYDFVYFCDLQQLGAEILATGILLSLGFLLFKQVLNFNRMNWKNVSLVFVTWQNSENNWEIC